jgi:sugar lactone lactonase YvrE
MRPTVHVRSAVARALAAVLCATVAVAAWGAPERVVEGLVNPESVLVGPRGVIYVSQIGEFAKDGDGSVVRVKADGTLEPFATGLNDPKGLAHDGTYLYVTDRDQIWRIDAKGKATVFVARQAFPVVPKFLNDIVQDGAGHLYVSDSGAKGIGGAIFKVSSKGKVNLVTNTSLDPLVKSPNGLVIDPLGSLLVVDFATGDLYRISLKTRKSEKIASGFGGGDGLALDRHRQLYISDWKNGHVWRMPLGSRKPVSSKYEQTFEAAADLTLDGSQRFLIVPDMKAGTLTWLPVKP